MKLLFFCGVVFQVALAAPVEINSKNIKLLLEKNNNRVLAAQLQVQGAMEREGYLARSFAPALKLNAGVEDFKTGLYQSKSQSLYGIEGQVNLFNGGRDKIESVIREQTTELQLTQRQQTLARELGEARALYWEILYLRKHQELLEAAVKINQANSQAAQRRIKSGVATKTDSIEFEMEAVNLQRELQATQVLFSNQREMLKVVLNLEDHDELLFNEVLDHGLASEQELGEVVKYTDRDFEFSFKGQQLSSELNRLKADQLKRALWPRVDTYASYHQYDQRSKDFARASDRDESVVGIKISIDLPAGLESNRDAAAYQYLSRSDDQRAKIEQRETKTHLANEIKQLHFLHQQVHDAQENIKRAEQYYELTHAEYGRGVKNSPDVLGASQRLLNQRQKKLEIIKEFELAKGHVLAQLGR